jgi:dipeptidyl aminopeptidase/acylaminoacyl peptidase
MVRIAWLALALLLAAPTLRASASLVVASCFLAEFLAGHRLRPLSAITRPPRVEPLPAATREGRIVAADLYGHAGITRPAGLVLVHGLAPDGKDEPRLAAAATLLARAGWAVAVPTVDGLTRLRLRPADADAVAAAVEALRRRGHAPISVIGVSLGAGPALLAAADPAHAGLISAVLALGGYASTTELLRYTLTGAYRYGEIHGLRRPDETAIARFARANAELVDEAGRRLVDNRDPARVDALIAALPGETRRLLAALAPETRVADIGAPLFLVHGRSDPAVPFTEALRLAALARRAGRPARVAIVGGLGHVEGDPGATVGDLWRLWRLVYAFWVISARAA